jgi:hypothetical protein
MNRKYSQTNLDWEQVGYAAMAETRDDTRARQTCSLKLAALADELKPLMAAGAKRIGELRGRVQALHAQLYNRAHPISDLRMIATGMLCVFLLAMFGVTFPASVVGNTMTLLNFGWDFSVCSIVGTLGTALVTIVGYLAHVKLLSKHQALETTAVAIVTVLTIWALIDFGRGRGGMTEKANSDQAVESFVDEPASQGAVADPARDDHGPSNKSIIGFFSDALTKLTVVADIAVGLLLGAFMTRWTGDDYAGWRTLRAEKAEIARVEHRHDEMIAMIEMARKRCAAGIVRAAHLQAPSHSPYLVPALLLMLMGGAHGVLAQDNIKREEVIAIDLSGSIRKPETRNLFNEFMQAVRQLLRTEPPDSRTWALAISTDSFGGVTPIVKGWTPSAAGIFTDKLDQARRQLVAGFDAKAAGLSPSAMGTDLFGVLARANAAFESVPDSAHLVRDLYLFTDGVNESSFNMPALLPTGVDNMMRVARTNRLIVPLAGVRVYVYGASTAGLTPEAWSTIRSFWTAYFEAAGAKLVVYSTETSVVRR